MIKDFFVEDLSNSYLRLINYTEKKTDYIKKIAFEHNDNNKHE